MTTLQGFDFAAWAKANSDLRLVSKTTLAWRCWASAMPAQAEASTT